MADIYANDYGKKPINSGIVPSGAIEVYKVAKAAAISDKIYFGIIPAGTLVTDVELINDARASATLSLGFEPVNAAPAADLTAWLSAQTLANAGRFQSIAHPIKFNEDVKLVGTVGGAALLVTTKLSVVVKGKGEGVV